MENGLSSSLAEARRGFDDLVRELRPRLHRYCARMTGSVIDGEDVVQEALAKAFFALSSMTAVRNLEAWMFRIAHNAALDHLRRRARLNDGQVDLDMEQVADGVSVVENRYAARAALAAFMRLSPRQRSCIILKDVLGYSLAEIGALTDASAASVKAALYRGRLRLREVADEPAELPPAALSEPEKSLLGFYADRFNDRDFDAIRARLAEEVRLDLVGRARRQGRSEVGQYFSNYDGVSDWRLAPGLVEGRPALLVGDPAYPERGPLYFILIDWRDGAVANIRDFRYARYVMADAVFVSAAANH